MKLDRSGIAQALFEAFRSGLVEALETMLKAPPLVAWESLPAAPSDLGFLWRQPLAPLAGALLVAASPADVATIGRQVMAAAGVSEASPEESPSTFQEALGQTLRSVARALSGRLGREVSPEGGEQAGADPTQASTAETRWAAVRITIGELKIALGVGLLPALADAIADALPQAPDDPQAPGDEPAPEAPQALVTAAGTRESRGLELLLDVELPVSVSFGKASVALKDVLKLTNGSIIELSRVVVEPVDVVVNNCVIAPGEVVVVEGNFGVRIQRVVSRGERLQTFP